MNIKIRNFPAYNYRSIFHKGNTIRQKYDDALPFLTPPHPEIEDVAINNKCLAGCSYCYTSALRSGNNFSNIVEKAHEVWGTLPDNARPNQIAVGGAGESTLHPDWIPFVKSVREMGVLPNYTTNGMHLTDSILRATEEYCGGVALSWHPHIPKVFREAVSKLRKTDTNVNVHIILGSEQSLIDLQELYNDYRDIFKYFVVLPYQSVGRGKPLADVESVYKRGFDFINAVDKSKFAFGALFYDYILEQGAPFELSLYEPEMFSGYRVMDESYCVLRKSSYDLTEK